MARLPRAAALASRKGHDAEDKARKYRKRQSAKERSFARAFKVDVLRCGLPGLPGDWRDGRNMGPASDALSPLL